MSVKQHYTEIIYIVVNTKMSVSLLLIILGKWSLSRQPQCLILEFDFNNLIFPKDLFSAAAMVRNRP